MTRNYLLVFLLIFIYGCGHKTYDVYYQIETSQGWEDKHLISSWDKEYKIDKNTTISTMGLNISAYSKENSKFNFKKNNIEILVSYQSYNNHRCKKEDISIEINNKRLYPLTGRNAYYGDIIPPLTGCSYLFEKNPLNVDTFSIYFNDINHNIPPLKFKKRVEERYHGPPA